MDDQALNRIADALGPWNTAEAREWWETRAPTLKADAAGAVSTGLEELEIDLDDRDDPAKVSDAPVTRVAATPPGAKG